MAFRIQKNEPSIAGTVQLPGSKSISNRALILRALCGQDFPIVGLSTATDTATLDRLLRERPRIWDAGHAGTTFRFLTAYLAFQPGEQIMTGSERMRQRPIHPLVTALRKLGADISYLSSAGFPPLRIGEASLSAENHITIPADVSSQFVTALLLIAPTLPKGLKISLEGNVVSQPYISMTLSLMRHFGVRSRWSSRQISVGRQDYQAKPFRVEADWSAASYFFGMAALCQRADLLLAGLGPDSLQGDAVLRELMGPFGVQSTFESQGLRILRQADTALPGAFVYDFLHCPDLAQTLAVLCAGLGVPARFAGLDTLNTKETDRIAALRSELGKIGVSFGASDPPLSGKGAPRFSMHGNARFEQTPVFSTYQDHRMAMAFSMLALLHPVYIEDPSVVSKSFPGYWEQLERLGFGIEESD
jgi:3-phosphoshikimate 1-carboxyvinyltransferase